MSQSKDAASPKQQEEKETLPKHIDLNIRAIHYVVIVLYVLCLFVILVISHFGFEGGILFLIASVLDNAYLFLLIEKGSG